MVTLTNPERLNRIRAGILGANDGIVSVAALLFGVAAARPAVLLPAALAAIIAGACSMALGEYVSVHAQADAEREAGGPVTATPIGAALSSATSFVAGAVLPAAAVCLTPHSIRIPVATAAVLAALALSGYASSKLSDVPPLLPVLRVTSGGALALAVTYLAGLLAGAVG